MVRGILACPITPVLLGVHEPAASQGQPSRSIRRRADAGRGPWPVGSGFGRPCDAGYRPLNRVPTPVAAAAMVRPLPDPSMRDRMEASHQPPGPDPLT